jgi:hypothetical protein
MKAYIVNPLYQAPGGPGTSANNVVTAVGVGIRIEPIATSTTVATFPGNRHVLLDGAGQVNCAFSGSSWIPQHFTSFQFGIEFAGTNASDAWLVYVAEEGDDPGTYGGVGVPWSAQYMYNAATKLYTGPAPQASPLPISGSVNATLVASSITLPVSIASTVAIQGYVANAPASNIKQASGTVNAGTPVNISSGLTGGTGECTALIFSNASAAGILTVSIGGSGNPGYQLGPNQSVEIDGINVSSVPIWVEASASGISYNATALYT